MGLDMLGFCEVRIIRSTCSLGLIATKESIEDMQLNSYCILLSYSVLKQVLDWYLQKPNIFLTI